MGPGPPRPRSNRFYVYLVAILFCVGEGAGILEYGPGAAEAEK